MSIATHNSGSYKFDYNVSFWNLKNKWEWLRILAKFFPCFRNKITSLSKCQDITIFDQLNLGVDILDLRISFSNDIFYISHTFCCDLLSEVLEQILKFLKQNPQSYITIMLFPDFTNKNTLLDKECLLLKTIETTFGTYINNVKLFYQPLKIDLNLYHNFINSNILNNIWYDVQTVDEFITRFNETDFSDCYLLGCILTPPENNNEWYKLLSINLNEYANQLNPVALKLLSTNISQKKTIPFVCSFDYINEKLIKKYKTIMKEFY